MAKKGSKKSEPSAVTKAMASRFKGRMPLAILKKRLAKLQKIVKEREAGA